VTASVEKRKKIGPVEMSDEGRENSGQVKGENELGLGEAGGRLGTCWKAGHGGGRKESRELI
jgi:hypothetical protein